MSLAAAAPAKKIDAVDRTGFDRWSFCIQRCVTLACSGYAISTARHAIHAARNVGSYTLGLFVNMRYENDSDILATTGNRGVGHLDHRGDSISCLSVRGDGQGGSASGHEPVRFRNGVAGGHDSDGDGSEHRVRADRRVSSESAVAVCVGLLLAALAIIAFVVVSEVFYVAGTSSAIMAAACLITAAFLAASWMGDQMSDQQPQQPQQGMEITTPIGGVKISGANVFAAFQSQGLTNALLIVIGLGLFYHDSGNATLAREAMAIAKEANGVAKVANFINLQSEAKRIELGQQIAEPEELRKLRRTYTP
jgi:hypothetical protein